MQLPNGSDRNKVEYLAQKLQNIHSSVILPFHVVSNKAFSSSNAHTMDSTYLPHKGLALDGVDVREDVKDFLNPLPTVDDYGVINFKARADKLKAENGQSVYGALIQVDAVSVKVKENITNPYSPDDVAAIQTDWMNMEIYLRGVSGHESKLRTQICPSVAQYAGGVQQWITSDGLHIRGWIDDSDIPDGASLEDYELVMVGWLEFFGEIPASYVDVIGTVTILQDFTYEPSPE